MKTILVTGAGGYIGSHVVSALLDLGYDVIACDLVTDRIDPRATRIACDLFAPDAPIDRFGTPDALLHLAWRDGFVHHSLRHLEDLGAHYTFLERMIAQGTRRICVMGSMHEIGYHEGAIDESTPQNPSSLYGIAKNALRQSLCALARQKEFSLLWLRGYYILGDDCRNHSIFAKILEKEQAGEATFPFTTGKNKCDFLHVSDLALEIALCVVSAQQGIINCCSGKPISLGEQVEAFIAQHDLRIRPAYGAFPDRPYDSPVIYGDSTRVRAVLADFLATENDTTSAVAQHAAALLAHLQ